MKDHGSVSVQAHKIVTLVSLVLPLTASVVCDPPIAIPITNVSLANSQVRRGLPIRIGTPPQTLAFLPQWAKNNTYVYQSSGAYCPSNTTGAACTTYRGGLYDIDASTSRIERSAFDAGADPYDILGGLRGTFIATNQSLMRFMKDDLSLSSNITLGGFPIGVPGDDIGQQQAEPQAILGLGGNSTLLSALRKNEQISSRSYGIFSGLTGVTSASQMDGSLVLGGYDQAKTSGRNITGPLTDVTLCRSQMMVTVTGMSLNWPNRTDTSVFAREGDAFRACLIPDYPLAMSLPGEVFQRINANFDSTFVDRSTGVNFWGVAYDGRGGAPYDGDLTAQIEIAGQSLDIRIPNDQLVLPDISIAETGAMNVNYSKQVVMLDALAAETEMLLPIIGRSFLSSAYVFVNQDAGTFTLWAANATTESDIVPIARDGSIVDTCGLRLVGTDSPESGDTSGSTPARLTIGAIAGIAVGSAAALMVVAAAAFFIIRRRRQSQGSPDSPDGVTSTHYQQSHIPYDPQEMVGSHFRDPHEVEGVGKAAHAELGASHARYELAAPAAVSELHDGKSPATTVSGKHGY
ncbi:aspartic peptidase domain-containing protein [Elsinoe ampelina]|uniref:Aspartic peptidase domain-containing protein n=1 Tax=Elsinoe ampelina TaxID=302913 RepID=A0A6A6GMN8_9PEZI|nr:aspartic peptidase domain-containing protein [Elsinoe ampelina]